MKKALQNPICRAFGNRGGDSRIRTGDPMLAKHVLYQLSYTPGKQKSETTSYAESFRFL